VSFLLRESAWKASNISFLGEHFKTFIYEKSFVCQREKNKTYRERRTAINHGKIKSMYGGENPGTAKE
jgi:hypothetical protein